MLKVKESINIINEVNASSGVLNLLKSAANVTDAEFYEKYILPLIHVADWVQELPANKLHHFEVGGAIRFAIHCGFASVRLSESFIFTPASQSEYRYTLEKDFRYAAFLATIFSTIAYPFSYLQIFNEDGEVWGKSNPLNSFAENYDLQWIANAQLDSKKGIFYASRIIPMQLLDGFNQSVIDELMRALSPDSVPSGNETSMQKTVRQSIKSIIDIEKKRISQQFTETSLVQYQADDIVVESKLEVRSDNNSTKNTDKLSEFTKELVVNSNITFQSELPTDLLKTLDVGVAEVLRLLKEDLANGSASSEKIKPDRLGLMMPSSLLSKYGLPLPHIEGELRRKSMVVKKEGQIYYLKKELGAWLMADVNSSAGDLFGATDD